jgi:GMP synthase (glutamine-hydrolysing)
VFSQLRAADTIVNDFLKEKNQLLTKISQVPVILISVDFEGKKQRHSIVIRPFITNDFMTGLGSRARCRNFKPYI